MNYAQLVEQIFILLLPCFPFLNTVPQFFFILFMSKWRFLSLLFVLLFFYVSCCFCFKCFSLSLSLSDHLFFTSLRFVLLVFSFCYNINMAFCALEVNLCVWLCMYSTVCL